MRLTRRQVPILDLCERLKAAGVSQRETYWVWQKNPFGGWILTHNKLLQQGLMGENKDIKYSKFLVDAPTVAELGKMLPEYVFSMRRSPNKYVCMDYMNYRTVDFGSFVASNEADARAKMLVYLLEKRLMTP